MSLLEVKNLSVAFPVDYTLIDRFRGNPRQVLTAVDNVSLSVDEGASVGIVGESGCGKSTLARAIIGLVAPTSGTVTFEGRDLGVRRSKALHRQIQMVFQDPGSSLNPSMTVRGVLTELFDVHEIVPKDRYEQRCEELMDLVELPTRLLGVRPRRLSGGQRQRVGIARALALNPSVLIADESVAALDVSVQASVLNLLADLRRDLGLTLLFISHDLSVIRHLSDQVVVMYLGAIVEAGPVETVFDNPRHPYTRALIAAAPRLKSGAIAEIPIKGEPPSPLEMPEGCRFSPRCPVAIDVCFSESPDLRKMDTGDVACHLADETVSPPS